MPSRETEFYMNFYIFAEWVVDNQQASCLALCNLHRSVMESQPAFQAMADMSAELIHEDGPMQSFLKRIKDTNEQITGNMLAKLGSLDQRVDALSSTLSDVKGITASLAKNTPPCTYPTEALNLPQPPPAKPTKQTTTLTPTPLFAPETNPVYPSAPNPANTNPF
ncbi:hypothetical protein BDM02DRAFT_3194206 [Thelephora ganbajun]|uniref:Uncharacterized protein n=1 Tax=Thelephora ganbajun TaxID=370292 RepID=A0ACB6YWY4_THEGA|nr:hypothetical protein BDM02DRAFT_3194206 [Thelephora ganbajun]